MFGKSSEISKIRNFRTFRKLRKMMCNSKFENHEKLVPTQKPTRKLGKKFGMQGLNNCT